MRAKRIIYLGFNDFRQHKRGVENVILTQSQSFSLLQGNAIYIYFGSKKHVFKYKNITCIEVPKSLFRFVQFNLILFYLSKKFIKRQDFFIIHSHNYLLSFFLFRKTDIFTVHDGLYYYKKCEKAGVGLLWKLIEKSVYSRSKKIHFISDFSYSNSLATHPSYTSKVKKIYNTTPLESLYTRSLPLPFKSKKYNILVVRSIEKRANIELVIDLSKRLSQERIEALVTVIGKGPLLFHFINIVKNENLDNIQMLGYVEDEQLIKYYQDCDLVLVPCNYGEGFGLPVIEGYLFDKPVLASNRCALPEVIIDPQFLFENIPDKLLDMVENMVMAPPIFSYNAFYLKHFSKSVIEAKYKSLYKSFF